MAGFGRVQKSRRRAGVARVGGDLVAELPRLAHAGDDDAAPPGQDAGLHERCVEPGGTQCLGFGQQRPPAQFQDCTSPRATAEGGGAGSVVMGS